MKRDLKESRSYSFLTIRQVNEDKRIIEGIATTPEQARDGDIVETQGIQFKLPIPFLYRHSEPFGNVVAAKRSDDGISVKIQIAEAGVSAAIDEYWRLIKSGVVRGLSIGFRILQEAFDKEIGGYRIMKSEWLELSAVPVPADPNATITSVRSADEAILAALGHGNRPSNGRIKPQLPGVPGSSTKQGANHMKSISQRITALEAERGPIAARMTELMGESLEIPEADQAEYDGLIEKLEPVDKDLKRLRAFETASATAIPVKPEAAESHRAAQQSRGRIVQEVKSNIPKGNTAARMIIALFQARSNRHYAAELAEKYYSDTPEVALSLRATVDALDSTTATAAAPLIPAYQQLQSEFIELLRPATILGRIPNLRRVPFNVAVPLQTGGGTYNWVGEAAGKPVTSAAFDSAPLRWAKAAGIIVLTQELLRFSSPSAEAIIRDEMVQGCARFLDTAFVGAAAEVSNVSPAGIVNGISVTSPSGTTADAFRYDMNVLLGKFVTNSQDPSTAVLLMSATTALGLSLMVNALGQREFPDISINGGTVAGLPAIVSETVGTKIELINARDVLFADDGGFNVQISTEASIEMSTTPLAGEESPVTGAILKSMFQNNLAALRVERFITWKRSRTSAVEYLSPVAYAPTQPS